MSYTEDMGYFEPNIYELSDDWEKGIHIDRDGNEHEIKKMTDIHLLNTIKLFKDIFDTSALEEEAKKRNIL